MQLFYNEFVEENSTEIIFDKEESKHIVKVLRKHLGDILYITNGKGVLFEAKIISDNEKKCVVTICNSEVKPKKRYYLHLVVAPTKMNERYEWFLEKATEIGVDEITPIICEHSERTSVKTDRFDRIILSAMKQSLQTYKPILNPPISFSDFLKKEWNFSKFIAHCQETDKKEFATELQKKSTEKNLILIGPEGDFSSSEIEKALQKGFKPVLLGKTRLRTETAAVVACHTISVVDLIKNEL